MSIESLKRQFLGEKKMLIGISTGTPKLLKVDKDRERSFFHKKKKNGIESRGLWNQKVSKEKEELKQCNIRCKRKGALSKYGIHHKH